VFAYKIIDLINQKVSLHYLQVGMRIVAIVRSIFSVSFCLLCWILGCDVHGRFM